MARECGAICRNFSILPGICRADRAHRGSRCAPLEGSGTGRWLQLQATLRAPIIFQPLHPSFLWHSAAPAGAETRRKGVEGAGSLPRSGVFSWPDPAGGIQEGRYGRPWRWRGWLESRVYAPGSRQILRGGRGRTCGATWKAPIPELRMSLRPTLHPRPHLPPPLRNKWICCLVNVPLEVAVSKI